MAKKLGKLLMVTAALGAVAGGLYYYLKDRDSLVDDDFDNFDEDADENEADRTYVDLDLGKKDENKDADADKNAADENKEEKSDGKVEETVAGAAEEVKEEFKEGIQTAKAEAAEKIAGGVKKVEEFYDDDDKAAQAH